MIPLFDWLAQRPKYFKNYVTKNPEQFQDTPDLAEDFNSPILPTQRPRLFQYSKMWSHAHDKDILENWCFWQRSFWSLSKRKGRIFIMPCLALVILSFSCHALLWSCFHALLHFSMLLLKKSVPKTKIFSSTIDSPRFGDKKRNLLFTVTIHYHYSSVTVHDTVHSEFLPI